MIVMNEEEITTMRKWNIIPRWEINREAHQSTLHTNNSIDNRRPINQSTEKTVPSENIGTYQSTWSTGHSDNRNAYRTSGQSNKEHQSTHSTVERERCEMIRHEQQSMDYSEVGRYQYVDTYPDHRQSTFRSSDRTHHERFTEYPETYTRYSQLLRNMPDYTHTKGNYAEPQTYVPPETIQPDTGI